MTKFLPAFPAIGALIGLGVYFPFLWLFVDYHKDVEHYYDEVVKIHRTLRPVMTREYLSNEPDNLSKCDPYTIEEPKTEDGQIILRKMVEHKSGWGEPIIRTIGTIPVYKTSYEVTCNLDSRPAKLEVPKLTVPKLTVPKLDVSKLDVPRLTVPKLDVPKLGPYRSVKEIDRQIVGYITETELVFEKPFKPLDISYAASLLGSAFFLAKLFCRPVSES